MWITWDSWLRTYFHEIFWFEANDKYFDWYDCRFKVTILTNTILNFVLMSLQLEQSHCVATEYKKNLKPVLTGTE